MKSRLRSADLRRTVTTVTVLLVVQAVLVVAFVLPGYKPHAHADALRRRRGRDGEAEPTETVEPLEERRAA